MGRASEAMQIELNEEQNKAIDAMSQIFAIQTKEPLLCIVDDIKELQLRQTQILKNASKASIWFNKEQRIRLNEMSKTMNKITAYRKKLHSMKQSVANIDKKSKQTEKRNKLLKR